MVLLFIGRVLAEQPSLMFSTIFPSVTQSLGSWMKGCCTMAEACKIHFKASQLVRIDCRHLVLWKWGYFREQMYFNAKNSEPVGLMLGVDGTSSKSNGNPLNSPNHACGPLSTWLIQPSYRSNHMRERERGETGTFELIVWGWNINVDLFVYRLEHHDRLHIFELICMALLEAKYTHWPDENDSLRSHQMFGHWSSLRLRRVPRYMS